VTALLALAASALWGTSDFGGGLISRKLDASVVVFLSQAMALAGLLVLLPFLPVHAGRYMLAAAVAGVLATLSLAAFYRAMATAPMPLVAPITASGTAIPVLTGLLRGEHLSVAQLAGIGVTLTGIVLACGPEWSAGAPVRRQALALSVAAAIGFGAAYTLLGLAASSGVYGTLLCQRIGGLVVIGPLVLRAGLLRGIRLTGRRIPALAAVGGCDVVANGSYALAASGGHLSVAAVLASLYPVVTAVLARIILAERLRPVQTAGVVAALGGVVLLSA